MSYSLSLTTEAKLDLQDAWLWYEKQRFGLGDELLLSVEATLNEIERTPLLYQVHVPNVRIALLKRFPYKVVYMLDQNQIIIVGILHNKRDPSIWVTRSIND